MAFWSFVAGCIIRLNKKLEVCLVEFRETWQWLLEKCILDVATLEAKEDYGTDQMCREMDAEIKRGVHVMRFLW